MDVVRLNSDSYLPELLVEGYSSMIWTERFFTNGDFNMVTPKIAETRALIPEGSHIGLLDSPEVMRVETHDVKVNDDGIPELTITGRTFETFLENRTATGVYKEPWSTYKNYKPSELIAYFLWNYLVNTTNQDPSRVGQTKDSRDAIAHLVVTNSVTFAETALSWSLEEGDIYTQLKNVLGLGLLGVRNIRPPGTAGYVTSFDTSGGGTRGDVSKTLVPDISDMRLDVFNGLDRTRFQSDREAIIFHYESGHIDSPSYLFSIADFKNQALVSSDIGNFDVWPETGTTPPSTIPAGLNRRLLYVDGGTQGDADTGIFTQSIIQKGMIELAKHNRKVLFDGAISPVSPYKYGEQYSLGDAVSLIAQYGFEAEMIVAEYVRTEDLNGDRGYPTLIVSS